jgi:hypothetical protein
LLALGWLSCYAQPVISAHAGLILFTDGAVLLDGKSYEPRSGHYSEVPENATLQTQAGKADLLLAPGIFLRLGDHSTVRLLSNKLFDVQVELLAGSAIFDSGRPEPDNWVRLIYRERRIAMPSRGGYRIDSQSDRIAVFSGQLEVCNREAILAVPEHHQLSFETGELRDLAETPPDPLDLWAQDRQRIDNPSPPVKRDVRKKWWAHLWEIAAPRG